MTTNELREAFQRFYEERGHLRVPGHSLIPPAEDLSTLFISAGMQQFKPYFLRTKEPPSPRVVSVQQCLRAGGKDTDLEEVGRTERHCSFFEMMGNFSFGDYYKDEAVDFAWDWVTERARPRAGPALGDGPRGRPGAQARRGQGRDRCVAPQGNPAGADRPARQGQLLAVGRDRPVRAVLGDLLRPRRQVRVRRPAELRAGPLRPDHGDLQPRLHGVRPAARERARRPADAERRHRATASSAPPASCRTSSSVFDTDGFRQIMDWIEAESGVPYRESEISLRAHRVLADHGRAASFLIAEGIEPSNEGRGYICRRLLRRAIHQASRIGLHDSHRLSRVVVGQMGDAYPLLARARRRDRADVARRGGAVLRDARARAARVRRSREPAGDRRGGCVHARRDVRVPDRADAGARGGARPAGRHRRLPRRSWRSTASSRVPAATRATCSARPSSRRAAGFESEFVGYAKLDVLTQAGAVEDLGDGTFFCKLRESPFYAESGGQITDSGELVHEESGAVAVLRAAYKIGDDQALLFEGSGFATGDRVRAVVTWSQRFPTMTNHTATHLLHQALRDVLGDHVKQAGSAVRPDKLRFDFTHPSGLSAEERDRVERIVNEKVFEAIPVRTYVTPIEEARKLGAMMLFGEKYGDEVRVVEIGELLARALRRHPRPLDGRDRAVRDPQREGGRLGRAPDRSGHRRRGVERPRGAEPRAERDPGRGGAAAPRREEAEGRGRRAGHRVAGPPGQRVRRRGEGRARQCAARLLRPAAAARGRVGRRARVDRRRQGRARREPRQRARRRSTP